MSFSPAILAMILAYFMWGLFPWYWRLLSAVSPYEILAHRQVWSLVFLMVIWIFLAKFVAIKPWRDKAVLLNYALSAVLLTFNWGVYIWAVNAGYVIETSLGYFINPLVSVLLGVLVLNEKLRSVQWLTIGFAFMGLIYLTIFHGSFPLIAVSLALSFGLYGLVKKQAPLPAIQGMTIETLWMFFPALIFLMYRGYQGEVGFGHLDVETDVGLIMGGLVTLLPLLLYSYGTQRLPLYLVGMLQYIAPSMHFLIGYFLFEEEFSQQQWIGYSLVWIAVGIFAIEGYWHHGQEKLSNSAAL